MAFTMPSFPLLNAEQASPYANLLQKLLSGYQSGVQTQYMKPMAEQDLQKAVLQNALSKQKQEWNPKIWQSEIGLRGAQTGKLGKETQWYDREAGARIGQQQAETDKIRYLLGHPGLMGGEETKTLQTLIDMSKAGLIPPINTSSPQLQQPQQNQAMGQQNQPIASLPLGAEMQQGIPSYLKQNNQQMQQVSNPIAEASQTQVNQTNQGLPFKTGNPLVDSMLNRKYMLAAHQQQMTQGYNWSHLPGETKNQLVAQGYGMGVDPLKMMNYVNKGMGMSEIAKAEGLDPENLPPPVYAPTTATKTRVQQVEQVGRELDYLSSATTPIIKQYADTFAGISGARIKDMLSSDPEAQKRFGDYIGAISLQTGLANGRVLMEGGRPGVEVMRMVKDSALKGIDQLSPIKMTGIAYEAAQKRIDETLQKGAKIRTTTGMNPFSEIGKSRMKSEETPEKMPTKKRSKWVPGKGLVEVTQ